MIDTWSMVHAFLLVLVCTGQVYFLRSLFNEPVSTKGVKIRA